MLFFGRARHPGPCIPLGPPRIGIKFLNVVGWLAEGDLALESQAHFVAVAEHRLVLAGARNVTTQIRKSGISSVWALACQNATPGRHAEVRVVSLHGGSSFPSCIGYFCLR